MIVVLVEVARKAYLASLVPVIVYTILNEHQIIVDIVAFVNKGDFPRSRLGEKQRGKILASWVTNKMRTMAQFGIRDAEGGLADVMEASEPRQSGSIRNSVLGGSMRNIEPPAQILEQGESEGYPTPVVELPDHSYGNSLHDSNTRSDDTATASRSGVPSVTELPAVVPVNDNTTPTQTYIPFQPEQSAPAYAPPPIPQYDGPPPVGPKPGAAPQLPPLQLPPLPLPAVDGREGDLWTLPSQKPAGLNGRPSTAEQDADDWSRSMHSTLAQR
jgi:hypothetical protein